MSDWKLRTSMLVVAGATAACVARGLGLGSELDPAPFTGCYVVDIGPWTTTGAWMGLVPPERFRLDAVVVVDSINPRTQYRVAALLPLRPALDAMPPTWTPLAADSLTVVWFNGYALGSLRMRAFGDSVEGVAHTRSDVRTGYPDPTASVRGKRVPCTATSGAG